ncbi:MAG: hypothetical protein A3K61_03445 [Thaumarchaeota archaeon RBG_16_49_8]|nr:MAG: hypothetical protein A3K61_03445 [Thaumarchaeota archaeon RBG_16_49_8]
MKGEMANVDYKILEDPRMAKKALQMLLKTKEDLDDFIDTLEILSNPRFRKNLEKGLSEAKEGKAVKLSVEELRKRFE